MARRPPIAAGPFPPDTIHWRDDPMVKPEWGSKRTCPKCSTRFYDLAKDEPVTCISCGHAWLPEPVLKSKQPLPFESAAPAEVVKEDEDLAAEELVPDE